MFAFPKLPEEYEPQEPSDGLPAHEVAQLKGHDGPVFAVRYNQQGTYCVTGGKVRFCLYLLHALMLYPRVCIMSHHLPASTP